MARTGSKQRSLRALATLFSRNGYFRTPRNQTTPIESHRGYELRFTAFDDAERDAILKHLERLGIRSGRPYWHNDRQWRIPVYGREQVAELGDKLLKHGPRT
jgi:hypothetical protein